MHFCLRVLRSCSCGVRCLGHDTVSLAVLFPTFGRNILPPSARVKLSKRSHLPIDIASCWRRTKCLCCLHFCRGNTYTAMLYDCNSFFLVLWLCFRVWSQSHVLCASSLYVVCVWELCWQRKGTNVPAAVSSVCVKAQACLLTSVRHFRPFIAPSCVHIHT
jgi:hypothetical protein